MWDNAHQVGMKYDLETNILSFKCFCGFEAQTSDEKLTMKENRINALINIASRHNDTTKEITNVGQVISTSEESG